MSSYAFIASNCRREIRFCSVPTACTVQSTMVLSRKSWTRPPAPRKKSRDSFNAPISMEVRITRLPSCWSGQMDKIGTYQILEVLHRGPQPLYRAKGKDGKEVAIKAVPVAGLSPEMRERFTREAETAKKLDHQI